MTNSNEGASATAAEQWDNRYQEKPAMWSGNPNDVLVDVAGALDPGTALDLGCGEGADAIWLAQRGWRVLAVDISAVAVARARDAAANAGLDEERVRFAQIDLADARDGIRGQFDLVTASFLHSTVELPRTEILRRASQFVAVGGHMLITTHAATPPWAGKHFEVRDHGSRHAHEFLTPEEEIRALDLPPESWRTVIAETRLRETTSPDGEPASLEDGVVLLQRT